MTKTPPGWRKSTKQLSSSMFLRQYSLYAFCVCRTRARCLWCASPFFPGRTCMRFPSDKNLDVGTLLIIACADAFIVSLLDSLKSSFQSSSFRLFPLSSLCHHSLFFFVPVFGD